MAAAGNRPVSNTPAGLPTGRTPQPRPTVPSGEIPRADAALAARRNEAENPAPDFWSLKSTASDQACPHVVRTPFDSPLCHGARARRQPAFRRSLPEGRRCGAGFRQPRHRHGLQWLGSWIRRAAGILG